MYYQLKLGKIPSTGLSDIVLTNFFRTNARTHSQTDERTHALTEGQPENKMSPSTPIGGGDIKSITELEKVALDGSVECCATPPRWCDLEL